MGRGDDGLSAVELYLRDIDREPALTAEEEGAPARAVDQGRRAAAALGAAPATLEGDRLYQAVREATGVTGAAGPAFAAERYLPRVAPANAPLNWRARDLDELWGSPIAGSRGPTVGDAVAEVLQPDGEVARRLDCLGQGIVEAFEVLDVPLLRRWLGRKAREAYHHGFVAALARDSRQTVAAVVDTVATGVPAPISVQA
jgi:hypothetical protein